MAKKNRPLFKPVVYGEITQGTIFSCATASNYPHKIVHGLTITARCDFAQSKYPVLNYLPIVTLHDWFRCDGLEIMLEAELSEQDGNIRKMLRDASIPESMPKAVSLRIIANTHFPLDEGSKKERDKSKRFHELITSFDSFLGVQSGSPDDIYAWFAKNKPAKISELIKRLSKHAVAGHYLLEYLSDDEENASGYVCLLREVSTIPRFIAERIAEGLDSQTHSELIAEADSKVSSLVIDHGDMAMPVSEIASPVIEHILQSFSLLYGRIGIADPHKPTIQLLEKSCLQQPEGA
ncbi:hypothetical protein MALG_01672 [Marinovum algicola DG 898]|nr:hypothetical protein MALG_01672 [Marinovum algicola DG 898]